MDDLLVLIGTTYEPNELGVMIATEARVPVLAHIESASRSEWYRAGMVGHQAEIVAITNAANYMGEQTAELNGKRYAIYRTYRPENSDEIELYLEEKLGARQ